MNFDWSRYQSLASQLKDEGLHQPVDEAKLRCAISRAYYAAFRTALNFLRSEQWNEPNRDIHAAVRDNFQYDSDDERQKVGEKLRDMVMRRRWADYDDEYDRRHPQNNRRVQQHAADTVILSRQVITILSTITPRQNASGVDGQTTTN